MKKILIIFGVLAIFIGHDVKAETYFVNKNNVNLTKSQYDYISKLYYEGYQNFITEDEYNTLVQNDLFQQEVESKSMVTFERSNTRSTNIYANKRTLTISKSCNTNCMITLKAVWDGIPIVQSYDVIGMRFANTSPISINQCSITSNSYSNSYSNSSENYKNANYGFGYSVKIPNSSGIVLLTSATVNTGGTVYGAYEHALSNVTLATSKNYNISSAGQGSVFAFTGSAIGKYDNTSGVEINT